MTATPTQPSPVPPFANAQRAVLGMLALGPSDDELRESEQIGTLFLGDPITRPLGAFADERGWTPEAFTHMAHAHG